MFVPGDNDIGGEYGEPVVKSNVNRFKKSFPNTDYKSVNNETIIISVNRITHEMPNYDKNLLENSSVRIIISHYSLLIISGTYPHTVS